MSIIITNDAGEDVEVFTQEELAEKESALKAQYEAQLVTEKEQRESAERKIAEKTNDLKRLRDMTEEQKKTYTAKELELMAQMENVQTEFESFKNQTEDYRKSTINNTIDKAIKMYSSGNEELANKIRENLEIINIPVNNEDDAILKVEKAVALSGNVVKNPFTASFSGVAPKSEAKDDGRISQDEFKKLIY
jgi:flagellar biosynthesis GTPase FlhF